MNQAFIRCLDNESKTTALRKHANHKQTPREPEMPFKTLIDKIDQKDLTRTITNNQKRLCEVNESATDINKDLQQISAACNIIKHLNQNHLEQFEGTICRTELTTHTTENRTELTTHTTEKNLKEDPTLHYSIVIAVPMDTPRDDVLKDQNGKAHLD